MNARQKDYALRNKMERAGMLVSAETANTLRRAELTLQRWGELECGDSNDYQSFGIERDETTDKPYMVTRPHTSDKVRRTAIADRESGALKRIAKLCAEHKFYFFHQTDPRGCALYVSNLPLTDNNYTHGVACCE